MSDAWEEVWHHGVAPQLTDAELECLIKGLDESDTRIIQASNCQPPPLDFLHDWPVEAGDPIAYALWQANGIKTVGELTESWFAVITKAEESLGMAGAIGYFIQWWDSTPILEAFDKLRDEAQIALWDRMAERHGECETVEYNL